ncbi:hypothetical protein FIBSPDRAFT_777805 [Athelia psychrophila]|uniref:Uncharacterized protein n=1 Tax=Athelia psychrophila TaxID=1759441 RepID=A0A166T2Q7_9AGAM|nr:hypothetical protein FIBSPDRAFT_777805 [Fibularhizoctonia sp. CBS 109695]
MSPSVSPIRVTLQASPVSAAAQLLERKSSSTQKGAAESDLLRSIRAALRGSGTDPIAAVHSSTFTHDSAQTEITWNAQTVVLSAGGIIRKQWNFEEEGQPIQWACISFYQLSTPMGSRSSGSASRYTSDNDGVPATGATSSSESATFGPFTLAQREQEKEKEHALLCPAVFVFLRSIGKIYLLNGLEYTFSLPFIVRKAWALHPHGVMIQRVLDPSEVEEAELTGDTVLPTIFSVTSPFSEAASVGLTSGVLGGTGDLLDTLKDELENTSRPLKSIPATETVVWVSHRGPGATDDVLVTVDNERLQLSIWRYVHIKPKDTPLPLGRDTHKRNLSKKRASMSGVPGILPGTRRQSAMMTEFVDEFGQMSPGSGSNHPYEREHSPTPSEFPEPFVPLPGRPPALSATATLASLVPGASSQWPAPGHGGRLSLTRNDLSVTMDRMVLGGRMDVEMALAPVEHGRMKAAYWMEKLHTQDITDADSKAFSKISVALFDQRWDGKEERTHMGICLPSTESLLMFTLTRTPDETKMYTTLKLNVLPPLTAISVTSVRSSRGSIHDALLVKPDGHAYLVTHGLREIPLQFKSKKPHSNLMAVDGNNVRKIVAVENASMSIVTLVHRDGTKSLASLDLTPSDPTTCQALHVLAQTLPSQQSFALHHAFLTAWSARGFATSHGVEFECFESAFARVFDLDNELPPAPPPNAWQALNHSPYHDRFCADPALERLQLPAQKQAPVTPRRVRPAHPMLAPALYALHIMGEDMRVMRLRHEALLRLASLLCRIALIIRPEWADYWKRLCPDAMPGWPSSATTIIEFLDDRLPVWPVDMSALLYGRINNPDWKITWHDTASLTVFFGITASFEYGRMEPLNSLYLLTQIYMCLSDSEVKDTQRRADNAIYALVKSGAGSDFLDGLPLGIAAPIREAARTCQLSPPSQWPEEAYKLIGRDDLAAGVRHHTPDVLFNDGYKPMKDYINSSTRKSIGSLIAEASAASAGEVESVSGVELDLEGFTEIRFGQDRRLEEVARMLCSSNIPSVKITERPELNEHDQAKDQQHQVVRIAERTLALPFGRAMFTFGSVPMVTRESYTIPKMEFTIRMQPQNITACPEPDKIPQECIHWGEFHNGVAAGLRISPLTRGVESSWIAFNKPSDLTPEHAGFLFGLGLTGHLKDMMTWHTFAYLTPKHDLTSIGVLLGLSAANIGSGNKHVTKLLAVHTPALLPSPAVDLNVSLMTQAAGLMGVGLLYLGTKNRRMAEVCLNQISRKELVQPDLSNEHREAYTYAAGLAFGMTMLGKGTSIPADMAFVDRLRVLIHGDSDATLGKRGRIAFDINLTSPSAAMGLGLMFLRTGRRDIADILAPPDTVLALNKIQPSMLLIRTVARSLILWDAIAPTHEWLSMQVPTGVTKAMHVHFAGKPIDDALELAYYNILAGCCFAIGLKYAGTARQEAYLLIISYFDMFSRLVYSNGPAFDHKIKRSAVREGLNLISISLSMVMAGTGEITCFRRFRYAYGMYHQAFRYGVHVASHISLGLLFLGGGRFTLGTSNAAVACMVTAFFPRFHHVSSDNKSYLQALRHLWVLAVEPRCLLARDVDTDEVVYLPVKITMREGAEVGTTQLIAPTLIPDLGKLLSVRIDTPRYWPFLLDTAHDPQHRKALLRSQTLYVKRRTAFLSYTEDPRGSRSLFVRSGAASAGDAATLDFPRLGAGADEDAPDEHPAGDLAEFISSFSNDVLFLAFADRFACGTGERMLSAYCHAALLDSIMQDKPQTLQVHLLLYLYRTPRARARYFNLWLQDLKFLAEFYKMVYDRRFSGRTEGGARPPLVRESTVLGALHTLDEALDVVRGRAGFLETLARYVSGDADDGSAMEEREMAWYLLRDNVPGATILGLLQGLAQEAQALCAGRAPPEGVAGQTGREGEYLTAGIKEVLHGAGSKMINATGAGWSVRSLEEIVQAWSIA